MHQLQRDLGRVEAKVEVLTEDSKLIKADLADIKRHIHNQTAIKEADWKKLSVVAVLASIATHIFNWVKPFFT